MTTHCGKRQPRWKRPSGSGESKGSRSGSTIPGCLFSPCSTYSLAESFFPSLYEQLVDRPVLDHRGHRELAPLRVGRRPRTRAFVYRDRQRYTGPQHYALHLRRRRQPEPGNQGRQDGIPGRDRRSGRPLWIAVVRPRHVPAAWRQRTVLCRLPISRARKRHPGRLQSRPRLPARWRARLSLHRLGRHQQHGTRDPIATRLGVIIGYLFIIAGVFVVFTGDSSQASGSGRSAGSCRTPPTQSMQQFGCRRQSKVCRRLLMERESAGRRSWRHARQLVDHHIIGHNSAACRWSSRACCSASLR